MTAHADDGHAARAGRRQTAAAGRSGRRGGGRVALVMTGRLARVPDVAGDRADRRPPRTACPAACDPADLNLLLVTLDTTRADRLGAYGFKADRDAESRSHRPRRRAVRARRRAGAADAAGALVALHRQAPAGARRSRQRRLLPRRARDDDGRAAEEPRDSATGGFVGAYVLDHKWGIAQGFENYFDDFDLSKYRSVSLGSVERPGNEVADHALEWLDTRRLVEILRLGPLLRRALALRSARAVQIALLPIGRTPAKSRSSTRRSAACSLARHPPAAREDDRRRHGRSRREPGRSRRGHARLLRLRERPARAAADPGAVRRHARPQGRRRRPQRGRAADSARPPGDPIERDVRGPEPASADDRRPRASSGSKPTPRRCIRASTSAGATCGR